MTFGEVNDMIEFNSKAEKNRQKSRAIMDYKLAEIIGYNVARTLNSENQVPTIEEIYSFLFADELEQIKQAKAKQETDIYKAKFRAFIDRHNIQRKEVD